MYNYRKGKIQKRGSLIQNLAIVGFDTDGSREKNRGQHTDFAQGKFERKGMFVCYLIQTLGP